MTPQPSDLCPGIKSPFGNHPYRPCVEHCERYRWASDDMVPMMRWNPDTKKRECAHMVERGAR